MSIAPSWITPSGNLGTIVEGEFYQFQLLANNADFFNFHSGRLPGGLEITPNGTIEGHPKEYALIQGVPTEVGEDITSRFVVRATKDGKVSDRLFQLTITGQNAPIIDPTPPTELGTFIDGSEVNIQLTAFDPDPLDVLTWGVLSGELPDGITLSTEGKLQGYISPIPNVNGVAGFDVNSFDMVNFDFRTRAINKFYQFTVFVTDGKDKTSKTYQMFVIARNTILADTDLYTADMMDSITSDLTNLRNPVLLTQSTDIGLVKHDNYFSYKFDGLDFDGDPITYSITTGEGLGFDSELTAFDTDFFDRHEFSLPPGLVLNSSTGWLSGYIPFQFFTTQLYRFAIRVEKSNNSEYVSKWVYFNMTIEGDVNKVVTWPNSNLGIINTGQISELSVAANISTNEAVRYQLLDGSASRLPQGLRLNEDGIIVGRVSFETMMFDTGLTTFDKNDIFRAETTIDKIFRFTVRVFNSDLTIDTSQEFFVKLEFRTLHPYENLYAVALPEQEQRNIYNTLIHNSDDIPYRDIYRPGDHNFGKQQSIRMIIAAGLIASSKTRYIEAMAKNHYNTILRFGEMKTARALNQDGSVRYEVVYIELTDKNIGKDPITNLPKSVASSINLSRQTGWQNRMRIDSSHPKISTGTITIDAIDQNTIYPNSIVNMRRRIQQEIGQEILERRVLPAWMQDKQADGRILGHILAVPIVFCKPGTAERIKFLLSRRIEVDVKKISFEIDRFILDNNLSKWFNIEEKTYNLTSETSFDYELSQISPSINNPTTFDGGGTKFFEEIDVFAAQNEGDKYIKFPQIGVFR